MHRVGSSKRLGSVLFLVVLLMTACGGSGVESTESIQTNPCGPNAEAEDMGVEGRVPAPEAKVVDVTATDYAFEALETQYSPGEYGFRLLNKGQEFHELALVKVLDAQNRPVEELLSLPEPEQEAALEYIGGTVACPGQTSESVGAALKPGDYAVVCFVNVGLTPELPDTEQEDLMKNPTHYSKGMLTEFVVAAS